MQTFELGMYGQPPQQQSQVAAAALWPPRQPHPLHHAYANGMAGLGVGMGLLGSGSLDAPTSALMDSINGVGQLTWLSSKAGLITCSNKSTISFQIKDFCDQQLTDLTSVLRVGFTLSFTAQLSETMQYIATSVSPLYGEDAEKMFAGSGELDLEEHTPPTTPNNKDAYSRSLESRAIPTLLGIFQYGHSSPRTMLSSLHSHMSNCGDEEMFRYVGSSSLKRRQFVERRAHLFKLGGDDSVELQHPAVYSCVLLLANRLLRRGGATAIQSLYDYFRSSEMPTEISQHIGAGRAEFLSLVQSHPWVFAVFPNRTYVSVRRCLPHFDYPAYLAKNFPFSMDASAAQPAPQTVERPSSQLSFGRSLSRQQMPGGRWEGVTPLASPAEQWSFQQQQQQQWRPSGGSPPFSVLPVQQPQPPQKQKMVTMGTQTEPMQCGCGCACAGSVGGSRAPGPPPSWPPRGSGSASPPSLESASPASGRTGSPAAPGGGGMRLYDPFGFDLQNPARFSALNI